MPLRRSRVDALDVIAYTDGIVTLDLRVSSGTYVRAIAEALGGHCVALRRLEVGPFSVEDADEERRDPRRAGAGAAAVEHGGAARRARSGASGSAVAIGTFDGVHLGAPPGGRGRASTRACRVTVLTFQPHPRVVARQPRRAALDARAPARAARRARRRRDDAWSSSRSSVAQLEPEEFARRTCARSAAVVVAGADFRFGRRRRGDLELLERLGFEVLRRAAARGRLLDRDPPLAARGRRDDGRADARPARRSSTGSSSAATSAAARSATRRRTSRSSRRCSCPRYGIYAGRGARPPGRDLDRHESALRRRGAADRAVPARLRRRSLRPAARRRAVGAAPRRAGVRERAGADRPDRARRRSDAKGGQTGVGRLER